MFLKDVSGGRQVIRAAALCFSDDGQSAAERVPGLAVYRYGIDFSDTAKMVNRLWNGLYCPAALLFFSAAGIAVRQIAPYVADKMTDPAVIVINDTAEYVIPLLSGHAGQANALALHLSEILGAQAVITTASDHRKGMEAPDLWAAREGYTIQDRKDIKELTAALVAGGRPERIRRGSELIWRVHVSGTDPEGNSVKRTVTAVMFPRQYVVGLGCRRGTDPEKLSLFAEKQLKAAGLRHEQVFKICSIDLKSEELALQLLAKKWNRPFVVFPTEQLNRLEGEFSASAFVEKTTGTDNVCERSALAGCEPWGGRLLIRKAAEDGMTFAVAERQL